MSMQPARYRFGPLERRSILGGVRIGQAAVLGAGLLAAAITIDLEPSAPGAALCVAVLAIAAVLSTVRLGGRTADEWGRSLQLRAEDRRRAPPVPFRGAVVGGAFAISNGRLAIGRVRTPPTAKPRGRSADRRRSRGPTLGALSERHGRRLTTVLACRVVSFELLDPDAQQRRLDQWGIVLAGAAATDIRRLQWIERTAPAPGDELARWLHRARDPEIARRGEPIVESYLELISTSSRVAQSHEILVVVQVDGARGGARGKSDASRALVEATESGGAWAGGRRGDGPRRPAQRADLAPSEDGVRSVCAGRARRPWAADESRDELGEAGSWPLAANEKRDHYRCDGATTPPTGSAAGRGVTCRPCS